MSFRRFARNSEVSRGNRIFIYTPTAKAIAAIAPAMIVAAAARPAAPLDASNDGLGDADRVVPGR